MSLEDILIVALGLAAFIAVLSAVATLLVKLFVPQASWTQSARASGLGTLLGFGIWSLSPG